MKLEVGKFIRTPYGIRKIVNITKDDGYGKPKVRVIELDRHLNTPYKFDYIFYTDENVIKKCKASYNIIDLIEVGDYVNSKKIVDVGCLINGPRKGTKVIDYYITPSAVSYLENEDIKSVITHEQIEQMAYKVGE